MEKKHIYDNIVAITPQWVEARDKAERGGHFDGRLNLEERDCMALLNRQLDKIVDYNNGVAKPDVEPENPPERLPTSEEAVHWKC